jgi:serine/threonine protein kinase
MVHIKNVIKKILGMTGAKNDPWTCKECNQENTTVHKINGNFITELYGISQDPETKNYIMVLQYAKDGSLRNYLDTNYGKLSSFIIVYGLYRIHYKELIHRDLHIGNIFRKYK